MRTLVLCFAICCAVSPARTLIKNAALVITVDPSRGAGPLGLLENADVLLADDKIEAVGQGLSAEGATVVDATGKIVLPGFVDVHDHLWQSLIRGCAADRDLLGWLEQCVFPMGNGVLDEPEAFASVRLSLVDLAGAGVTTVLDDAHAFTPGFVRGNLRALEESKLRYVYAYCAFDATVTDATLADIRQVKRDIVDKNPLAGFQLCSHPSPHFAGSLKQMAKLAREMGVALNVHLLENIKQRQEKPMMLLAKAGALAPNLVVNHAVHLNDAEIRTLAKVKARVTHNPLSNMRLASGIAPLEKWRRAGLAIGLGLDGGTNDTVDPFANMKAAVGLQRAKTLRADVYPAIAEVIRLATLGGAEVLGLEQRIGSLTPGKQADVVLFNPAMINVAPRWDWVAQLVLTGQPINVEQVWVAGKVVKRGGVVLGSTREEVVQAAERAVLTLRKKLEKKK